MIGDTRGSRSDVGRIRAWTEGYGHRIQDAVFRCWMTARAVERLRWALTDLRDPADDVRILPLGTRCVDAERPAARVFGRAKPTRITDFVENQGQAVALRGPSSSVGAERPKEPPLCAVQ